MQSGGSVYLLTNHWDSVLYLGVTSNLIARVSEHRNKVHAGSFTAKYNCNKLVWYEMFSRMEEAIDREKKLKKWKHDWKAELIHQMNPEWKDLFDTLL